MKHPFDSLTNTVQPEIQTFGILNMLIRASRGPDQVIRLVKDLSLPIEPQKSFVRKEILE